MSFIVNIKQRIYSTINESDPSLDHQSSIREQWKDYKHYYKNSITADIKSYFLQLVDDKK